MRCKKKLNKNKLKKNTQRREITRTKKSRKGIKTASPLALPPGLKEISLKQFCTIFHLQPGDNLSPSTYKQKKTNCNKNATTTTTTAIGGKNKTNSTDDNNKKKFVKKITAIEY